MNLIFILKTPTRPFVFTLSMVDLAIYIFTMAILQISVQGSNIFDEDSGNITGHNSYRKTQKVWKIVSHSKFDLC